MSKTENSSEKNIARRLRIVDLFCGAGGMSIGWLRAAKERGAELVAAVDADDSLESVFETNFPHTRFLRHQYGDAFEANEASPVAAQLGLERDEVDVLLAGPPCQTFSAAGKRELGAESRLGYHVCDFAQFLQPKVVLIENVPEFSRVEDGRLIGRIRVRLSEAGYATEVIHLNAVDYGIPQTRTRCFTLGLREDLPFPTRQDFLSAFQSAPKAWVDDSSNAKSASQSTTVAQALSDLPPLAAGEGEQISTYKSPVEGVYQTYVRGNQECLFNHVAGLHSSKLLEAMETLRPGETPQDIENHPLRKKDYFRGAYARLDPEKPSATIDLLHKSIFAPVYRNALDEAGRTLVPLCKRSNDYPDSKPRLWPVYSLPRPPRFDSARSSPPARLP